MVLSGFYSLSLPRSRYVCIPVGWVPDGVASVCCGSRRWILLVHAARRDGQLPELTATATLRLELTWFLCQRSVWVNSLIHRCVHARCRGSSGAYLDEPKPQSVQTIDVIQYCFDRVR